MISYEIRMLERIGILTLAALIACTGCVSGSSEFDRSARQLALERRELVGLNFTHAVYARRDGVAVDRLHVYIGSDGTPWNGSKPSPDATPRNPVGLRLMAQDPGASVYIGRPCYHGAGDPEVCRPALWTSARYSDAVVRSMASVIEQYRRELGNPAIILIGYSGGGTLAALIAPRLNDVVGLVTVGANLDTDAWTDYFGYLPLTGSLNPALLPDDDAEVRQLHLLGESDPVVPPETIHRFRTNTPDARFVTYPGFDHKCCWEAEWPKILASIAHW